MSRSPNRCKERRKLVGTRPFVETMTGIMSFYEGHLVCQFKMFNKFIALGFDKVLVMRNGDVHSKYPLLCPVHQYFIRSVVKNSSVSDDGVVPVETDVVVLKNWLQHVLVIVMAIKIIFNKIYFVT